MPVLLLLVLATGSHGSAGIITRDSLSMQEVQGLCLDCHTRQVIRFSQNAVNKDEAGNTKPIPVDKHARRGVACASCHEASSGERVSMEQCLQCHDSYERLGELTRAVVPNPHVSHLGEIRCALCHKIHGKSELYCNTCHHSKFKLKVL